MMRARWVWLLGAIVVAETAWIVYPHARAVVLQLEESPAARGRRVAERLGCFGCHGPGGRGGVANPGSTWDEVPGFTEQTPMMFVGSDGDLREYILDGAPAAKRERESYRAEMAAQAIQMPAYRGWLDAAELEALVAYVRALSDLLGPDDPQAQRGAELARAYGCLGCHGPMGTGGLANPGSLKGYIPGFTGQDFTELVRSDDELRTWIRTGTIPRLREDPAAAFFLERQRTQMPAYDDFLSAEEIEALAAYVRWLAAGSWRAQPLLDH